MGEAKFSDTSNRFPFAGLATVEMAGQSGYAGLDCSILDGPDSRIRAGF